MLITDEKNTGLFAQYYLNVINALQQQQQEQPQYEQQQKQQEKHEKEEQEQEKENHQQQQQQQQHCSIKILNKIVECENDVERMKFLYNFNDLLDQHDNLLDISCKYNGKNIKIAEDFKTKGNSAFKDRHWHEALLSYNKSYVALLEHQVKEKAIILANRSAALYHLNKYDESLRDIKRSMDYDYPKELLYKLYERQARCYLAKKEYANAISCFQKFLTAMDDANNLTNEKRSKMNLDGMTMIKMLEQDPRAKHQQQQQQQEKLKKTGKIETCQPRYRTNAKNATGHLEFLNKSIAFEESPQEGRFAKALNNIQVAEELLIENAFVAVLLPKFSQTHCEHCFTRTIAPVACPTCADVIFCSEECSKRSIDTYHKYECGLLHTIRNSEVSVNCHMALRIIANQKSHDLLDISNNVERKFTVEEIRKFSRNDYRRICHLVRHENSRTATNFFQHALMARFLLKCLEKASYFQNESTTRTTTSPTTTTTTNEDKFIISGIILRTLQLLQFNTHEVFELHKLLNNGKEKTVFIGGALYPTLALFNHSCDPDVVRYFTGTTIHVNSIKSIPAGMNISENYGPMYTQANRDERRQQLKDLYHFDCFCLACLENWSTFDEFPNGIIRFRCETTNCQRAIEVPAESCNEFMIKCVNCGEKTNIFKALKVIQDTERMIKMAKHYYEVSDYKNALSRFSDLLKIMHEVLVPPFADYCQCQQYLKDCFLHYGNCYNMN